MRALLLIPAVMLWFCTAGPPAHSEQSKAGVKLTIPGRVVDRSGGALPRVRVAARESGGKIAAEAQTNSRGEFTLDLPEGRYAITATLAGFAPMSDYPLEARAPAQTITLVLDIPAIKQQITVTATKTETPLPQVGSSTTVLTGEQMAREGFGTVADALRRVAGLSLVQSGGRGSVTSLFIRGGESKYTKVLIDGIEVNEPGGGFNFANLSSTDVDRIEVVRGPQSALFGSDAIAGVVQIFTRRGSSDGLRPEPRFLLEGGKFSGYRYALGISGKGGRLDYSASFARSDTDNAVLNGSFNEETISGNLGFTPSKSAELRAVFRSEAGRTGVPGPWEFHRPDPDQYYRHRDLYGGLTFSQQVTTSWSQKLSYTATDSRQFSENPIDSGGYAVSYRGRTAPFPGTDFTYQNLDEIRRQKIQYQSDLVLPRGHLVTAGADYERETGTIGDPRNLPLEAKRSNFGAHLQDQWSFRNRLFAAGGVRLEKNQNSGLFAAPRLSLAAHLRHPAPGGLWGLTKIKGNFGLGIKEPTLIESYSQSPYFRGNPDLRPEKSAGFDAGLEQRFGADRAVVEVTYFDNRYRDQVAFVTTDYTTYEGKFFNLGKTRARGVETEIRQNLGGGFEVSGTYTFVDSRILIATNDFDPAYAKGRWLLRRPRHSGNLDLRWRSGRWTLGASGIFTGTRVDSDFAGMRFTSNPGYGILNLLADYRLSNGISCFALVNNALDKEYMEVLGYPALRAHYRIGIRAGF